MTYGVVRLVAGCKEEYLLDILGAITYFIEAFCFEYENRIGKTLVSFIYFYLKTIFYNLS
jgi:hypothetical protein